MSEPTDLSGKGPSCRSIRYTSRHLYQFQERSCCPPIPGRTLRCRVSGGYNRRIAPAASKPPRRRFHAIGDGAWAVRSFLLLARAVTHTRDLATHARCRWRWPTATASATHTTQHGTHSTSRLTTHTRASHNTQFPVYCTHDTTSEKIYSAPPYL